MKLSNVEGVYYTGWMLGIIAAYYSFPYLPFRFPHRIVYIIALFVVGAAVGYACERAYLRFRAAPPPRDPDEWGGPVL